MSASSEDCAAAGDATRSSAITRAAMVFIRSWYRFPRRLTQPRPNGGGFDGGLSFERHAVMADTLHDPQLASRELRAHEQTFHSFSKLVLFAILHIMLVLSCLALA